MDQENLPPIEEMWDAFERRDPSYDGIFVTAVATTGIFCRPTCPARKPARENVEFFAVAREALTAGYRPCKRCRPMENGEAPEWIAGLLDAVEADPSRRWKDEDLRKLGLEPERVRRWFQRHHGMTFHAYHRARRLGRAIGRLKDGAGPASAAFENGYESLSGFHEAFRRQTGTTPGRAGEEEPIFLRRLTTPLGPMIAGADEDALFLLEFADRRMLETQIERVRARTGRVAVPGVNDVIRRIGEELDAYFAGELRDFTVPLETPGSEFQRAVWEELRRIPYGETRSYGEQARRLGQPREAVRAVARANGDNRIAIVIPCHRVIGADGRLTGYGGGLWRKRRLLDLERAVAHGSVLGPLFAATASESSRRGQGAARR
ncbi:MAG TPA: methylated-DNA--[protein]-cysteine S-methyltransferase [Gemmatimonadota bacterium]|nr:methylated-DNA--[protein]-cysteine S-methyltransferase [Gemmatimonadota bacterium]